jgi:hypothetical protein
VLLGWLRGRGIGYLTASAARDPEVYQRIVDLKRKLRLAAPVHGSRRNPMLFFQNRTP